MNHNTIFKKLPIITGIAVTSILPIKSFGQMVNNVQPYWNTEHDTIRTTDNVRNKSSKDKVFFVSFKGADFYSSEYGLCPNLTHQFHTFDADERGEYHLVPRTMMVRKKNHIEYDTDDIYDKYFSLAYKTVPVGWLDNNQKKRHPALDISYAGPYTLITVINKKDELTKLYWSVVINTKTEEFVFISNTTNVPASIWRTKDGGIILCQPGATSENTIMLTPDGRGPTPAPEQSFILQRFNSKGH